jgi:hypothetical protein
MDRHKPGKPHEATPSTDLPRRPQDETGHGIVRDRPDLADSPVKPDLPKFGSAGSAGAELEP